MNPTATKRSAHFRADLIQTDLMAHLLRSLPMVDVGTLQAAGAEGVRRELIAFRKITRAALRRTWRRKSKHGARSAIDARRNLQRTPWQRLRAWRSGSIRDRAAHGVS